MTTTVLFLQGGGDDAHAWDAKLAKNLEQRLGPAYTVIFPEMPDESDPNYDAWTRRIRQELNGHDGAVLVGHSLGGSMLMKMLVEGDIDSSPAGVFLISAPFLHASEGWQWQELQLPTDARNKLPAGLPLYLYHGDADEEVSFSHLGLYAKTFPRAVIRALSGRNHQVNEDLTEVAEDIRKLAR